ncbi:unnamed protein product, partial [Prunus brigantina]
MMEEKVKKLDELNETLKMTKKKLSDSLYVNEVGMYELYHKFSTLEKENSNLIEKLNVLENDKSLFLHKLILFAFEKSLVEHEKVVMHDKFVVENSVLQRMLFEKNIEVQNLFEMVKSLENNMIKQSKSFDALQFENIRLEYELELEKEKIQGLTIGAEKINKILNLGKLFGDKRGLEYIDESSTPSSFETIFVKDVSNQEALKLVHDLNLDEDDILSPMLEGESPALDLVIDLSTFGIPVDLSTPDNSTSIEPTTCHYQPQNPNSSFLVDSSRTASRLNISYSVGVCASFQSDPKESHLFAVKIIIKYVSGTIDFGLWYTYDTSVNLVGYGNVDWVGCSDYKKSTSRGVLYVGNNLVAWYSKKKKKKTVSLSTTKAEYVAAGSCYIQLL